MKEFAEFTFELLSKLKYAENILKDSFFSYTTEINHEQEYLSFDFYFKKHNVKYQDSFFYYWNENNSEEFFESIEKFIKNAELLSKS